MKLLYCEICGDIIAPLRANNKARWCICGRFAVWWTDAQRGILRLHDSKKDEQEADGEEWRPYAYVLGINNAFLMYAGRIDADVVKHLDEICPDTYVFKRIHSPLIRVRPGETSDTAWSPLPVMA
jgi:hypothetical protein